MKMFFFSLINLLVFNFAYSQGQDFEKIKICAPTASCISAAQITGCHFEKMIDQVPCPDTISAGHGACSGLINCEEKGKQCSLVKKNGANECVDCYRACIDKIKDTSSTQSIATFDLCFNECTRKKIKR